MDIAIENELPHIIDMLTIKRSLAEYCNIKPSFRPMRRMKRQTLLFLVSFTFGMFFHSYLFTYIINMNFMIAFWGMNFLSYMIFFLLCFMDPGHLPK